MVPVRPFHADAVHAFAHLVNLVRDLAGQEVERDGDLFYGSALFHTDLLCSLSAVNRLLSRSIFFVARSTIRSCCS